jgi:glycosyltransferase involved in cell wall biosynthesis
MESLPRLVVFSDDWGRHPSSSQHLVRELLPRWKVDWVNTIGTRRPSFTMADAARAFDKARAWLQPRGTSAPLPENLTVHSPVHWPGFGSRIERGVNARLFDARLRPLLERADAVVTTAPITADLALRTREANWTYYCVDDLSEWPGLDAEAMRSMELDMLPAMKHVVAVSQHLVERLRGLGREARLLTHGIRLSHWKEVALRGPRERSDKPVATFWGHADTRLDVDIVLALARTCELRMYGPRSVLDARLEDERSMRWMGNVPFADLPAAAMDSDVLVMPYADLPVTRAMQPLKLKEYLATMLPVVATPLPANREWQDALDLEGDARAFAARVLERAFERLPTAQAAARARLQQEGWDKKALLFEQWIRRS